MKTIFKAGVLSLMLVGVACDKNVDSEVTDNNAGKKITVYLTDAPAAYDKVNVDLTGVMIKYADDPDNWASLTVNAGIYDLLSLQNGVSVVIASGTVSSSDIKEIKLVLGANNTIVVNGESKPLTIPSGAENGLKLKFPGQETVDLQNLLIDFDAALSVHKTGQGAYILRPVLKMKKKS